MVPETLHLIRPMGAFYRASERVTDVATFGGEAAMGADRGIFLPVARRIIIGALS